MSALIRLFLHDLRLQLRLGTDLIAPVAFFALATLMVPLGVGPEPNLLTRLAPGMLWVTALLATLLALDRLFQRDFEDGTLDLLALSPLPLEMTVLAKVAAHWVTTGLPLLVVAPILGVMLRLNPDTYVTMEISLLLGTPVLSMIGAFGAALVRPAGSRGGGGRICFTGRGREFDTWPQRDWHCSGVSHQPEQRDRYCAAADGQRGNVRTDGARAAFYAGIWGGSAGRASGDPAMGRDGGASAGDAGVGGLVGVLADAAGVAAGRLGPMAGCIVSVGVRTLEAAMCLGAT